MMIYELRMLDFSGQHLASHLFECGGDSDACEFARGLVPMCDAVEVFKGQTFLTSLTHRMTTAGAPGDL